MSDNPKRINSCLVLKETSEYPSLWESGLIKWSNQLKPNSLILPALNTETIQFRENRIELIRLNSPKFWDHFTTCNESYHIVELEHIFHFQDCRVIIWRKNEKEGGQWTHQVLHKFNDAIWHVSWSLAGNILAVSGADNKVGGTTNDSSASWMISSRHQLIASIFFFF